MSDLCLYNLLLLLGNKDEIISPFKISPQLNSDCQPPFEKHCCNPISKTDVLFVKKHFLIVDLWVVCHHTDCLRMITAANAA